MSFHAKDSRIVVWDINVGNVILTLTGHNGGVTGIQLNGSIAASASYDGTIRLWNVLEGSCISVFSEANNFVRCVGYIGTVGPSNEICMGGCVTYPQ